VFRNQVAIVGAGVVKSERRSRSAIGSLAVQMSDAAIADAGLTRSDIDGISCGTSLPADAARTLRPGFDYVDSTYLVEHMELEPVWSLDDGSFPPALAKAVIAVASGAASCVLVNRTVHNPAGRYHHFGGLEATGRDQWTAPYGYVGWISGMAMAYREYQERFGARRADMAALVLQQRANAQRIPQTYWHGRPLTFDDYMSSRMISEPLCLLDNDIPVDGGGSFIVTTAARAQDLPHPPVYVTSYAKIRKFAPWLPGTLGTLDEYYEGGADLAGRLWRNSGWHPGDCDVVELYDGFTMEVWYWLEVLGFCRQGEAWQLTGDGRIAPDGGFPLNTGAGNQGWGRLHGVPQVLECYLQLAGRADERQRAGTTTAISTYGDPAHEIGTAFLYSNDSAA
jgi:acetyl-CoA acetyltransferase